MKRQELTINQMKTLSNYPKGQSRSASLIESLTNILIGWLVAIVSQLVIFPWFDIDVPFRTNLYISFWFTGISLVRSFTLRRIFNLLTVRSRHRRP